MKRSAYVATIAALTICAWQTAPRLARCQGNPDISEMVRRELAIDQETRKALEPTKVLAQGALLDYGGLFRFSIATFDSFRDGRPLKRTFRSYDARLWLSLTLDEIHKFYFRTRYNVMDFNANESFGGDHVTGPNIDQAFYSVELDKLAQRYWGSEWGMKAKLTLGEQYLYIGSGMVYSQVDDGVLAEASVGDWDIKALASRTRGRDDNIDRSPAVDANERYFAGLELAYAGIPQHRPYAYVLVQEDESGERERVTLPDGRPATQRFDYESRYLGAGATGEIARGLGYRLEGILEYGQSYGDLSRTDHRQTGRDQDHILAYGANAGIDYYVEHKMKPRVAIDYYVASGDEHRASTANTIGGNKPGTTDRGFVGFGFVDTGFSFAPRFSNLRFLRVDGSVQPAREVHYLKDFEVGMTYFLYHKDRKSGGVSDEDRVSRFLGCELDTYVNWRILSDVTLSLRYALFMPGDAFSDRSARHFLFGTITCSF